ncbi:MAG: family 78 glycoside hydrolase catalytic domain, partial [Peptococcaceae bacterium]|nr:family 78 glycoside hydrolase catalytic domain [Peptococcaceae bacterium]
EYILRGIGEECWHPHFTFQGFRYVRIDAFAGEPSLENFTGIVIHSDFKRTGTFSCGNEEINQLFRNTIWGQRGNFVDIPTDCPQRDERLGWTGDAQVFIKAAALNYQVAPFFKKWLTDLRLDQTNDTGVPHVIPDVLKSREPSGAWADAATICPWEIYRAYNDKRILERQYQSMRDWVEYIRAQGDSEFLWNTGAHFGDWLGMDAKEGSYKGRTADDFIATVFYAHSTKLLSQAAQVLGKKEESQTYHSLYENILKSFRQEFVTPNGRLTDDTQTAYVLALHFDLVENRERAIQRLAELIRMNDNKLTTGFVGTPYICHALSDNGQAELAYSLVLQTEYPSWLYSVRQGATTIWEHWDGIKPDGTFWSTDMNSYNHYAYGSIVDWMYTKAAGIQYEESEPGYKKILFHPIPDKRFGFTEASLETVYGTVKSGWKYEKDKIHFTFTVPHNTTAVFEAPDGKRTELGSGTHHFVV